MLRELKPGWNPMQFLLQGGQLIAEQANDAKKLAVKTAKKLAATASQKVETTINNINKDNEDWHKGTKKRRANVAITIVRLVFISAFLFYCPPLNHSFQTNPNKITNCF